MAPVGAAGYMIVAVLFVQAVMFGAAGGAIAWAVRLGVLWGGLATTAAFLATTVLFGSYRFEPVALHGLPFVILTFTTSWLTARSLETRARWRRIWAAPAGLGVALVVGFLCLRLLQVVFEFPFPRTR